MKKFVLIAAGVGLGFAAIAQKSQIRTAKNYLGEKNFEKAKAAIEQAINDPSTKDDPYAWHVRGTVYLAMQQEPANADKEYYNEAGSSLKKVVQLKSDYEKQDVNNKLFAVAIYNYNAALAAYNDQKYEQAYNKFGEVVDIYSLEQGKRFEGKNKAMDTIARQSSLYQAFSAYYANKYDQALPLLTKAKNDPIVNAPNVYLILAEVYEVKKDEANLLATLAEGKKVFPGDKMLMNRELNVFIKSGKSEQLVSKLEEAIQADPSNPDFLFTLGIAYDNMANPKDAKGAELPKPANYSDVFAKAEQAYMNTLKVADKADYNYNLGALYFNRAVLVNEQMNAITGTSAAELKKYDGLKDERDKWFDKALPYLEKTITSLDGQTSTLSGEDKNTYMGAIVAAKEIYAKQNKLEKATELKKKLESVQ